MDNKIEERFPWLPFIQRRFFETFSDDYDIGSLKHFQREIAKEIENIECKWDLKTAKHLLKVVEHFYFHFCRIWNYQKKFSSHMENTWVYLLSSLIKICLLLSQGRESKWTSHALNVIERFSGDKNLIYDALLFVHSLKNRFKPAYGAILKSLLMDMPLFVPVIIEDPVVFLKLYLLVRRMKLIIKDRAEKAELQMKVSKIIAPPSLWDWLLDHDFLVPWTKKGARKVNLGMNICRKLRCSESQMEIVETLRKTLLPGFLTKKEVEQEKSRGRRKSRRVYVSVSCAEQDSSEEDKENVLSGEENKRRARIKCVTVNCVFPVAPECRQITADERKNNSEKRKTDVSGPYADQASEDDKEEMAVNEIKVKNKKSKGMKEKIQEKGEEGMSASRLEMQNLNGTSEDNVIDSEENVSLTIDHSSAINTFDGELASVKKNTEKQELVHIDENLQCKIGCDNLPFQECSSKSVELSTEKTKLDKRTRKNNKANQILETKSCFLKGHVEDKKRSVNGGNRPETESENPQQKSEVGNSDSEGKHISKKRRQIEKSVTEENPDDENISFCNHSSFDISQTSKITKNRRKQQKRQPKQLDNKSQEIDFIDINDESDAESPVIVDETFVDKSVYDKSVCLSKRTADSNSSCSDDQPIILKEVKHCLDSDLTSSRKKKKKDTKIKLKSKSRGGNKIIAENLFISSESSPCFSEYDGEQKDTSCEKLESIDNSEESLADLQDKDLPEESNSQLKITDSSHVPEDSQGLCASNPSSLRSDKQEPLLVKGIRTPSNNQTSLNESGQDCKSEDGDNAFSSIMKEPLGYAVQTVVEFSQDSAVQTEGLDYPLNQTKDITENGIKSDPISKKLMDKRETIPIRAVLEKETTQKTNISQEMVEILESHETPVLEPISINSHSSQETEMQKNEYPSIETGELISVIDKVDLTETNHITFETTENNAKGIEGSEFPFENSLCNVKKDKITQENRVSESSIDSPLDNTCSLKTDKISSLSAAKTVSSVCVDFNSPEKKNIDKVEDNCSIKINSEAALENSASSLVETPIKYSFQEIMNTKNLTLDSSLSDKIKSEVVPDSDSYSSFEVDDLQVKKRRENTCDNMQGQSRNNSIDDQSRSQITGLFFDVKPLISKPEDGFLEDKEKSLTILDFKAQNLDGEAKSSMAETPNSSAKVIIDNVLKLVEFADCNKESIRQNIKEELTSAFNDPPIKISKSISSSANEKPSEYLSFLDISTKNADSLKERQSFVCHTPKISEFLRYRVLSSDQDDNRSEDAPSESKSISKADSSEYPSDASNDAESQESKLSPRDCNSPVSSDVSDTSNFKNCYDTCVVKIEYSWGDANTGQRFCECDACSSQGYKTGISKKVVQLKACMLNPVVNLGERCDKSFIDTNSSKSSDLLSDPTKSSVLSDIKSEDEQVNETMPLKSNQASLIVDPLLIPVNETAGKGETTEQLTSNAETHEVKEVCLIANQEFAAFSEDKVLFEQTGVKDLPQDHKATGCDKDLKLTICGKDPVSVKLTTEKEVSQDFKITRCDKEESTETKKEMELSLGMKLRKKPVKSVLIEKTMSGDEGSKVLNQDTPVTRCMNLRNRNTSTSSSQGKSTSADEDSSALNQEGPTTRCMNLRSKHPSMSSSQGKSLSANEDSSTLNQDTAATSCIKKNRNPSTPSIQEVGGQRSQTLTRHSLKRLKKDVNLNLGFDFSELSLNSPKATRSKPNGSSIKNSSEGVKDESPTRDQENPSRRSTRASIISSTVGTQIKEEDTDPEGYNLRSRKSVIMPGKLKF